MRPLQFLICFALVLSASHMCRAENTNQNGYIVFGGREDVPSVAVIPPGDHVTIDAELGEWNDTFTVITTPPLGLDFKSLRVEQRNKRCLTISNEGPHLDFYDWKSEFTPWKEMKRARWEKWSSATFDGADWPGFPAFTAEELEQQVRETLKEYSEGLGDWLALARRCAGEPGSCISQCETEIRFSRVNDGKTSVLRTIRIKIPMGC